MPERLEAERSCRSTEKVLRSARDFGSLVELICSDVRDVAGFEPIGVRHEVHVLQRMLSDRR